MKLAQTTLSRRDNLKIARRFNAGNGSPCASSPAGTAEPARPFRPSLRDSIHFATPPGVETPGYCRPSLRDKTAKPTGSTGHWPVPSGDSPDGMGWTPFRMRTRVFAGDVRSLPVGGSPTVTGGSPVPPIFENTFPTARAAGVN